MLSLKEIAELTNVSMSTVSRVLNNKGKISGETRKKVLAAVDELVFRPSVVAQPFPGLAQTFALYIPESGEYYHDTPSSSIDLRSLTDEIECQGNQAELIYQHDERDFGLIRAKFESNAIAGLVIIDPVVDNPSLGKIVAQTWPYVITNGYFRNAAHNVIDFNNYDGARQVARYLLEMGHRDIAILAGPQNHLVTQNRLDGVKDIMQEAGCALNPRLISFQKFDLESGYRGAQQLLATGQTFTAICAFSDFIAMGALKALKEHGFKIPTDVSLVGFDNLKISDFCDPPLTTVNRFSKEISYLIIKTLQDLIRFGANIETVNITLRTTLTIRQSVRQIA